MPDTIELNPLQQDLQWLAASAPLLDSRVHPAFMNAATPAYDAILAELLLRHEEPLTAALGVRQSQRLGIYYEVLWQQWLAHQPDNQLLAMNLQVIEGPNTMGEFDLIYQHKQTVIHREIAVKFYLGLPSTATAAPSYNNWIGPNLNDRLDKKVSKLQQQIVLSQTAAGKRALLARGINTPIQAEALLQGYLFYPWQHPCPPPLYAHFHHERGLWLTEKDLPHFLSSQPNKQSFICLPKQRWLAPFSSSDAQLQTLTTSELFSQTHTYFKNESRPQLICGGFHKNNTYNEHHRFFVVPNDWLAQARDVQQQSR